MCKAQAIPSKIEKQPWMPVSISAVFESLPDRHPGPNTDTFYHMCHVKKVFAVSSYQLITWSFILTILCFYCINNMHRGLFECTAAHFTQLKFRCWGWDVERFFLELNTIEDPMTMHTEKCEIIFFRNTLLISSNWCVKTISGLKTWAWNIIYLIKPANLLRELLRCTNAASGILVLKLLPVNPCRPDSNQNEQMWVNHCF